MPSPFSFQVLSQDAHTRARCGKITTGHGEILTPVFMPVGTQGTVKTLNRDELLEAGSQIILGNTYHLYLRRRPAQVRELAATDLDRQRRLSGLQLGGSAQDPRKRRALSVASRWILSRVHSGERGSHATRIGL